MSQPNTVDFKAPFDPTAYASITGAQLLQFLQGLYPNVDEGIVVITTDVATVPQVPDANTNTKWQRYLWVRQSVSSVGLYVWNAAGAADPTYLQWQSVNVAGIAVGSLVNSMYADNSITDNKIVSLSYSKLIGAPTGLAPSGPAGGVLTGTYPNPSIVAGGVTSAMIGVGQVMTANIADVNITVAKLAPASGSAKDMIRVNNTATAMETFTPPSIFTDANVTTTGNVGKVPTVATSGAGDTGTWQMTEPTAVGRILQMVETIDNTADTTALTCTLATLPTTANTKQPAGLTAAITPKNAASTLLVEVGMTLAGAGANTIAALFKDAGANAIAAGAEDSVGTSKPTCVLIRYSEAAGSLTARTFKTGFTGPSGSTAYNSTDGATKLFGGTLGVNSWIRVTEYI